MSYCVRCGKKLDDDSGLCEDCRKQQQNQTTEIAHSEVTADQVTATEEQTVGRMEGFGRALTSVILSAVGVVVALIFFFLACSGSGFALFMLFCALAPQIISLVLGIKSIKVFNRNKQEGRAKPVATLVLGIVGTVKSAVGMYIWIVFFMSASTVLNGSSTYGLTALTAFGLI